MLCRTYMTQTESNIDVLNLQDRHLSNHYISCRVKAQSSSAMLKIHQTLSYTLHGCSLNNRLGCLNGSFKQHPVSDSSLKALRRKKRHANNNEKNTVLTAPDSPSASQLFNLKQIPSSTSLLYMLSAFKIQQVIWAPTACPSQPSNSWLSEPAMWRKVLLNLIDNKTADRWILLPPFEWCSVLRWSFRTFLVMEAALTQECNRNKWLRRPSKKAAMPLVSEYVNNSWLDQSKSCMKVTRIIRVWWFGFQLLRLFLVTLFNGHSKSICRVKYRHISWYIIKTL